VSLLVAGILLLLLLADTAYAAVSARSSLTAARDDLQRGTDDLLAGRIPAASIAFDDAREAADTAASLTAHPGPTLAGWLPVIGDDVHAVDALAEAAVLTAEAGQTVMGAAERVGWTGIGVPGISAESPIPSAQIREAAPELQRAGAQLAEANDRLADVSLDGLIPPVRDAVVEARGELAGRAELVGSAADVAELVPGLLAEGRRYLLVIQNPGEPRGTGGFMGYFGTLEADGSRLQLTELTPVGEELVSPVRASADYRERWARFDGLIDLRQANFTPDVPTAAGVITQMTDELGWGHYDGMFFVDPIWMSYVLEATGPVTAPGWEREISADDVVDVLGRQIPALPDTPAIDALQGRIAQAVWEAIQTRDMSPSALGTAFSRSVQERHLQIWSRDAAQEALLDRLDASGRAELSRNPLYVVWSGVGASKMAIFADRSVATDVTLAEDGSATVTTTLTLRNTADPNAVFESALYGPGTDFPVGTFAAHVSVYQPKSVTEVPYFEASGPTATAQEHEFGHPVSAGFISAEAGGSMTWSVTYQVPDAVTEVDGVREYRLDYLPQPGFAPIPIDMAIRLPDGSAIVETSPGVRVDGATVSYRDAPAVPVPIWVRY
jgi:hypothetical protein